MTAKYKLIYFNFRGRAEIHRHLFDLAGQEFEDKRVTFDEWRNSKTSYPFHQLPVLEVTENGKTFCVAQSQAITRFLAERFKLAGRNDIEKAQCDMINEAVFKAIVDIQNLYQAIYREQNKEEMLRRLSEMAEGEVCDRLAQIQAILEANKDGGGFLVGNSLTYADIQVAVFYDVLRDKKDAVFARLPLLKAHNDKIRALPIVADHIKRNAHVHLSYLFAN